MKRCVSLLLLLLLVLSALTLPVLANSAPSRENGEAVVSTGSVAYTILVILLVVGVSMGITCFVEWLIAGWFHLGKHNNKLILKTNLASQLIMWAVFLVVLLLSNVWLIEIMIAYYWLVLICVETPIYVGEFLVYRKKMPEISWTRCLAYTVTANTASLLLGLVFL